MIKVFRYTFKYFKYFKVGIFYFINYNINFIK